MFKKNKISKSPESILYNNILLLSRNKLFFTKFDLSDTPDLLPAIAILVLKCKDQIEIYNVKHARFKETDRIAIICNELKKIGVRNKVTSFSY